MCAARRGAVAGLAPGGTYTFRVRGETGAGAGAAALWTEHMAIGAPPRPPPHALPAEVRLPPPPPPPPSTTSYPYRSNKGKSSYLNCSYTLTFLFAIRFPKISEKKNVKILFPLIP